MPDVEGKIVRLEAFIRLLDQWAESHSNDVRTEINREKAWVQQEVRRAGRQKLVTIAPPPAVGGMIMNNINPFDMIFDNPYLSSLVPTVRDMVQETIGVLESGTHNDAEDSANHILPGYVFIAMPIAPGDNDDVLDAIKEACQRCGLNAERIDELPTNERITDRILESIRKAQFVVADLTDSRPNVFYEAGYAHGIGKVPIYLARSGTHLEFDLKDYPVIFFSTLRQLKNELERRLRSLESR